MEYLDFSSVITIIRKYINDERTVVDRNLNEEVKIDQMHLLDQVFASFCDDADSLDFAFDNGQVCRWFNGQARISPRIISFYMDEENRDLLSADIEYNVLPLMYDSAMAVGDAHTLLIQNTTISPEVKNKLTVSYPCQTDRDKADFLAAGMHLHHLPDILQRYISVILHRAFRHQDGFSNLLIRHIRKKTKNYNFQSFLRQ